MSVIGFEYKPSAAILTIEDMELTWVQSMDKEHDVFQKLSNVDWFGYYFTNDILIIPDPKPVAREKWNMKIGINDYEIECRGSFLIFLNFNERKEGFIYADSLTLPQFEFLRSSIRCV